MTEGIIFNIQRYCIHDGPGIRTVVFLKGCPLKCLWCSNPESQNPRIEITINYNDCISCEKCQEICPANAIDIKGEQRFDLSKCNFCGKCVNACPKSVIKIYGRKVTVDEVIGEVLKDKVFYRRSNGGLTLSGGEPVMQPEFSAAIFDAARKKGIHSVLETAGFAKWENFWHVAQRADIVFFDLKHINSDKHKTLTGVDNNLILGNLEKLTVRGIKTVVRVPIIPGINDDDETIISIGKYIRNLKNVIRMGILPYHSFGKGKYAQLNRKYLLSHVNPPSQTQIEHIKDLLNKIELETLVGM